MVDRIGKPKILIQVPEEKKQNRLEATFKSTMTANIPK